MIKRKAKNGDLRLTSQGNVIVGFSLYFIVSVLLLCFIFNFADPVFYFLGVLLSLSNFGFVLVCMYTLLLEAHPCPKKSFFMWFLFFIFNILALLCIGFNVYYKSVFSYMFEIVGEKTKNTDQDEAFEMATDIV